MKRTSLILFLFYSLNLLSQTSDLQKTKIDTNFMWNNSTVSERDSFYFNLPNIEKSDYKTHFRLTHFGQIIDFKSNDDIIFKCIITNFISEYKEVKRKGERSDEKIRYIFEQKQLDSSRGSFVAKKILKTFSDSAFQNSLTANWFNVFSHCDDIEIQLKQNGLFFEETLYCPWNQPGTAKHADEVVLMYNLIKDTLKLDSIYNSFKSNLQRGKTYSTNDYGLIYYLTTKESLAWQKRKPEREYLKSIKDTIDNYLQLRIDEETDSSTNIDCYGYYGISFNKRGKMNHVSVYKSSKPNIRDGLSFYIEDLNEIWKCKKLIRSTFKDISLNSFNLKYNLKRTISFGRENQMILEK